MVTCNQCIKDRQLLIWPVLLWAQYIVDHYLTPKLPHIYNISLKISFPGHLIDIKYVQVIGLMIMWLYSKFHFFVIFFEQGYLIKKFHKNT